MSETVDPLAERVARAVSADRGLPCGVTALRDHFLTEASAKAYVEWLNHPVTKLFRGAVQDLMMNGPSYGIVTDAYPVHHGMTVAFSAVVQLLDNPGLIVRGMFSLKEGQRPPVSPGEPAQTFDTSPDDVLDEMEK